MKFVLSVFVSVLLFSCNEKETKVYDANDIINQSMVVSGADKIEASTITFDFRDIHYKAVRNRNGFMLSRVIVKDDDSIVDVLSNDGLERFINKSIINVPDSMAVKYTASVNSVHYFSVLPYGLNAKAVNKTYLDSVDIKGNSYHKIQVTFNEEGGGEDFEDVFIYWVHAKTNKIDYLAYSYNEDDGLGLRFREAYNERYIKGIRFVDYNNYKPKNNTVNLEDLDTLFIDQQLELLSKIELKNITVN